jgi:hypothetical protein
VRLGPGIGLRAVALLGHGETLPLWRSIDGTASVRSDGQRLSPQAEVCRGAGFLGSRTEG